MHWSDEAVVLGSRPHGETSAIAELLTRGHGRHLGLVHGGRSRKLRAVLQPGNLVVAGWRARLDDHLGTFALEPAGLRAAELMADPLKLSGLVTVIGLTQLLAEREPHPRLYDALRIMLDTLDNDRMWPAVLVRYELGLLDELGFGLDLARCAVTGSSDDLVYVSPRTGRAVSGEAGDPYRERLLAFPAFLTSAQADPRSPAELLAGLRLTGHFLARHVLEPRGLALPPARRLLIERLGRAEAPVGLEP